MLSKDNWSSKWWLCKGLFFKQDTNKKSFTKTPELRSEGNECLEKDAFAQAIVPFGLYEASYLDKSEKTR